VRVAAGVTIPFLADMGPPDPDVFYSSEGLDVIGGLYEGLLKYNLDNTNTVAPLLATSWEVSADGLTYTFHLRPGVTFHDGTPFTSTAAKASFARRTAVAGGSAYMLDSVGSTDTPDPLTFVVRLRQPVSAFLSYMASPYGPRMISPTILTHDAGKDQAQTYLQTHDGGTGPYTIASWVPNQHYTLERYAGYWGSAPEVGTINIPILPDISTQQLELTGGQLDMIVHGLTPDQLAPLAHNPKFTVTSFASLQANMLVINPNRGVFANPAVRAALIAGIDRAAVTRSVFGSNATVSNDIYPASMLGGTGGGEAPFAAGSLAAAVKGAGDTGRAVSIAYDLSDPFNGRVAELVGVALQAAGLRYTSTGMPDAQTFDLPNHPATAPDVLVVTTNPDAGHPDTWARIYMNTRGGINYLKCSVPAADAQMDVGLHATSSHAVEVAYEQAGDLLAQSNCWDVIANVKDTIVARRGIGGLTHQIPANATIVFASLRATG
jgi:peptide/nickel transport system substrate-binding protein